MTTSGRDVFQIEIRTRDLARAVPFYRAVFDWLVFPSGPDYALVETGGLPIVSLLQTANPRFPVGAVANILVDDVDVEAQRAVALGARISVPKSEVPNSGLYYGIVDPWGTELYLWQPFTDQRPAPKRVGKNPLSYVEFSGPDLPALTRFYSELFGWSFWSVVFKEAFVMAEGHGLKRGIGLCGGHAGCMNYIDVDQLEETAVKIQAAGGQILVAPSEFPGEGRYLIFEDPDGVRLGLIDRNKI